MWNLKPYQNNKRREKGSFHRSGPLTHSSTTSTTSFFFFAISSDLENDDYDNLPVGIFFTAVDGEKCNFYKLPSSSIPSECSGAERHVIIAQDSAVQKVQFAIRLKLLWRNNIFNVMRVPLKRLTSI